VLGDLLVGVKSRPFAAARRFAAPLRAWPLAWPSPSGPLGRQRSPDLHATTLLLAGVPVHVVVARLGHADPAITLRVYAHVIRSAEAAAADIFADAIKAAC
jgi:integrase